MCSRMVMTYSCACAGEWRQPTPVRFNRCRPLGPRLPRRNSPRKQRRARSRPPSPNTSSASMCSAAESSSNSSTMSTCPCTCAPTPRQAPSQPLPHHQRRQRRQAHFGQAPNARGGRRTRTVGEYTVGLAFSLSPADAAPPPPPPAEPARARNGVIDVSSTPQRLAGSHPPRTAPSHHRYRTCIRHGQGRNHNPTTPPHGRHG